MLVQQSAAAFTLWTGLPAPLQLMQERLDEARRASGAPPRSNADAAAGAESSLGRTPESPADADSSVEGADLIDAAASSVDTAAESPAEQPAMSEATRT
jgi:hypothetical protein